MDKHTLIIDLFTAAVREILDTGDCCPPNPQPKPPTDDPPYVIVRLAPKNEQEWPRPGGWDRMSISCYLALDEADGEIVSISHYSRKFGVSARRVTAILREEYLEMVQVKKNQYRLVRRWPNG